MVNDDLELYATQDLIEELVRRSAFQGVIVHAPPVKDRSWKGERVFSVRYNGNLDRDEAGRLLAVISDHLQFAGDGDIPLS